MKQLYPKDFKKKKSQDTFYNRVKTTTHREQLKYMCPRKSQPKFSSSLFEINPQSTKEHKKRVNSLQLGLNDLSLIEEVKPLKTNSITKIKHSIGDCYSDRNISHISDPAKLFKYRKFSSNADLPNEQIYISVPLKQKMGQINEKKAKAPKKTQAQSSQKFALTTWLIMIRKLYVQQSKKTANPLIVQSVMLQTLNKIDKAEIQSISGLVQPSTFEAELTKDQILTIITKFHIAIDKNKSEMKKKEKVIKLSYSDILNCFAKYLTNCCNNLNAQHRSSSSEEHEQVVETARFQQNHATQDLKKNKKAYESSSCLEITGKSSESQSYKTSYLCSQERKSSLTSKNKPNIFSSLHPFSIVEAKSNNHSSSSLSHYDSELGLFKKGYFHCQSKQQLGMLTLQGKSPRQLMQSQIYESMQKLGVSCPKSNLSFSLQNLQVDPHVSFEQSVHSFEQFLKKIKNIQTNYMQRLNSTEAKQLKNDEQISEEVNSFLQQLINYRIAVNSNYLGQNYSYLVSFENVNQGKQHNTKIMSVLLQSAYIKQYFLALQGIKFQNSQFLYQSVEPLLHQDLRILNLNNNDLSNINKVLSNMPENNCLQFLNINSNHFTNLCSIVAKFTKLRELHAKNNKVQKFTSLKQSSQIKILDLSYNLIAAEIDLSPLRMFVNLQIVNLIGNPLLQFKDWRFNWKGTINPKIIYEMQALFVMSSFGHQKDIAFSTKQSTSKSKQRKRELLPVRSKKNISDQIEQILYLNEQKLNKQNRLQQQPQAVDFSLSKDEKQIPKQRISKIKSILVGKAV